MEQNKTLDLEMLMSLGEEERAAAISAYNASIEDALRENVAAQYKSELKNARYEAAKYKMALDKTLPNFSERIEAIEEILSSNEAFATMGDEEKLRTAYYIDRGKSAPREQSTDELVAALSANPDAMRAVEAAVLEKLRHEKSPSFSAGYGAASMPLTPKAKPKNLNEASALAREAFGV